MEKSAWGVFGQKKTSRAKNLIRAKNNTSAAMLASEWLHHIKKHDLNKYQKIPSKNRAKKPIIRAKNSINRAKKPEITFCDDPVVCCAWMLFYIITMKTWQEIAEINSGKKKDIGRKTLNRSEKTAWMHSVKKTAWGSSRYTYSRVSSPHQW